METPFLTQRQRLIDAYAQSGEEFVASTIPYQSTLAVRFQIVERNATDQVAYAKAVAPQHLPFFSYGVGDSVNLGGTANVQATEAETNLARAKSTNGASDVVIEGVSIYQRGIRYAEPFAGPGGAPFADPDVIAAMAGNREILDPSAIIVAPQVHSPFNLENALFQALLPLMSLEFEFDRRRTLKLTAADILPQGGASSYLRSNGIPSPDCRWSIDEGLIWRRDGESDSELTVNVRLERTLVVPINLPSLPDAAAGAAANPSDIWLQVGMRLHGLQVDLPSEN